MILSEPLDDASYGSVIDAVGHLGIAVEVAENRVGVGVPGVVWIRAIGVYREVKRARETIASRLMILVVLDALHEQADLEFMLVPDLRQAVAEAVHHGVVDHRETAVIGDIGGIGHASTALRKADRGQQPQGVVVRIALL